MNPVHLVYLGCISTAQSLFWYATVGFGLGLGTSAVLGFSIVCAREKKLAICCFRCRLWVDYTRVQYL